MGMGMGFSSKKWAEITSKMASTLSFFIIILQLPLFRFPCRMGSCKTPVEVIACQLIASEIVPEFAVTALLYPGAIKSSFTKGTTIPSPDQLLSLYKFKMTKPNDSTDLQQLEVIAGSYLSVVGALVGCGRMSYLGLSLILWEMFAGKHASSDSSIIFPEMIIATVIAFFSVRRDVRKLIKCFRPRNCSKAKYC